MPMATTIAMSVCACVCVDLQSSFTALTNPGWPIDSDFSNRRMMQDRPEDSCQFTESFMRQRQAEGYTHITRFNDADRYGPTGKAGGAYFASKVCESLHAPHSHITHRAARCLWMCSYV